MSMNEVAVAVAKWLKGESFDGAPSKALAIEAELDSAYSEEAQLSQEIKDVVTGFVRNNAPKTYDIYHKQSEVKVALSNWVAVLEKAGRLIRLPDDASAYGEALGVFERLESKGVFVTHSRNALMWEWLALLVSTLPEEKLWQVSGTYSRQHVLAGFGNGDFHHVLYVRGGRSSDWVHAAPDNIVIEQAAVTGYASWLSEAARRQLELPVTGQLADLYTRFFEFEHDCGLCPAIRKYGDGDESGRHVGRTPYHLGLNASRDSLGSPDRDRAKEAAWKHAGKALSHDEWGREKDITRDEFERGWKEGEEE